MRVIMADYSYLDISTDIGLQGAQDNGSRKIDPIPRGVTAMTVHSATEF